MEAIKEPTIGKYTSSLSNELRSGHSGRLARGRVESGGCSKRRIVLLRNDHKK